MARHAFEQDTERDETEIAVDDARAGYVLEIEVCDRARRAFGFVFGEQVKRTPRGQSGSVRQQLAHGDHLSVGALEFRQVMKDGTVEREFAELDPARAEHAGDEWFR